MKHSFTAKAAVVGALALALVGSSVTAASAAAPVGPDYTAGQSAEQMYLWDGTEGAETLLSSTRVIGWGEQIFGYPKDTGFNQYDTYFTGPANAGSIETFLSNRGEEGDTSKWISRGFAGFADPVAKTVLTPPMTPENTVGLSLANVKANGGSFSMGIGYLDPEGVLVRGASFVHITVRPGGDYTYEPSTSTVVTPPVPGGSIGDIDISAPVVEADGSLKLTVPAAPVALGTATINAKGLSEASGSVTGIQVDDTRKTADRKGWNLTQSVADFTSGSNIIDKKNFGVAPMVISSTQGATPAAAQVAGSATYPAPFAGADAGTTTQTSTVLSAGLKLEAPAGTPAGTYTSKLTLTLVSK